VQILYKSYFPHPDSDLDVSHMNLDLLDDTYPMVKSKLHFMVFDHTGLTGGTHRSVRSDKTCQFWVRTQSLGDVDLCPHNQARSDAHNVFDEVLSDVIWDKELLHDFESHEGLV
jgi:hypothetical protein